jgi:hypothetical protein
MDDVPLPDRDDVRDNRESMAETRGTHGARRVQGQGWILGIHGLVGERSGSLDATDGALDLLARRHQGGDATHVDCPGDELVDPLDVGALDDGR